MRANSSDGFTILEMLVAFVILSASLVVTAQTISIAARGINNAAEQDDVLKLVDDLRAERLPQLATGQQQAEGRSGNLSWKIDIAATDGDRRVHSARLGFLAVQGAPPRSREYRFLLAMPSGEPADAPQ